MLFALLIACAPSPKDADHPETGAAADDSADTADSVGVDDTDDTVGTAPTGDALSDPVPLEAGAGTVTTSDSVDPEGDVDYWSVNLEEGQFLQVRTLTVAGDPEAQGFDCDGSYDTNPVDTVVEIYDPAGARIAASDDYPMGLCGRDSLALARAESGGTYVLAVTDWNNWSEGGALFGNAPVGGEEFSYTLLTTVTEAEASGGTLGDTPALAALAESTSWELQISARAWLTLYHPLGTNAGTDDLVFELDDAEGALLATVDSDAFYGSRWALGLVAPVEAGTYTLRVWDEDGVDAPEDWCWIWSETDEEQADNPEIEPDDTADQAVALALRAGDGEYEGDYVQATFDGSISPGDTDLFTAEVQDGQYLYLSVYTAQLGSPLLHQVVLFDVDGSTELATLDVDNPSLSRERPSADGSITLAITGQDDETSGYYLGYLEIWDERRPW